jgi:anti-sigma28 factor (negative regulator of flagellin synthesis)
MRIDPKLVTPVSTQPRREPRPTGSTTKPTPGAVVELSPAGAAASAGSRSPAQVTARIDQIRTLLQKGDYAVDLDQLASRIVDDELLRGGTA